MTATVVFDDLLYFLVLTLAMAPAAARFPILLLPLAAALAVQLGIFVILVWPRLYDALAGPVGRVPIVNRFQPELTLLGPTFRRLLRPRVVVPVAIVDAACTVLAIELYNPALTAVHAAGAGLTRVAFTYAAGQVISGRPCCPGP